MYIFYRTILNMSFSIDRLLLNMGKFLSCNQKSSRAFINNVTVRFSITTFSIFKEYYTAEQVDQWRRIENLNRSSYSVLWSMIYNRGYHFESGRKGFKSGITGYSFGRINLDPSSLYTYNKFQGD